MDIVLFADEFCFIGMNIINQPSNGSISIMTCCFKAHFGIDWMLCAKIWGCILPLLTNRDLNLNGVKMKHLLWTLLFLRLYDTEEVLAAKVGTGEKTYRKWVWMLIDIISYLRVDVVSDFIIVFYFITTI